MELNAYQAFIIKGLVHRSAHTKRSMDTPIFLMELAGEVGELINTYKHDIMWPDSATKDLVKTISEAGDVLWYLTAFLSSAGLTLEDAAAYNMKKLTERYGDMNESHSPL